MLGHDKSVRNGFTDIRYTVTIQSPAPEDKVRRCKETIDRKSPVRDTLANPVNITSRLRLQAEVSEAERRCRARSIACFTKGLIPFVERRSARREWRPYSARPGARAST